MRAARRSSANDPRSTHKGRASAWLIKARSDGSSAKWFQSMGRRWGRGHPWATVHLIFTIIPSITILVAIAKDNVMPTTNMQKLIFAPRSVCRYHIRVDCMPGLLLVVECLVGVLGVYSFAIPFSNYSMNLESLLFSLSSLLLTIF